jgi:hypothetical protein
MPNHCSNCLIVSAEMLEIIRENYIAQDKNGEDIFDFEKIIPIGDVPDGYKQRVEKWGTKWVGYDLSIGTTCIDFFTAWSPPIPIIKKLAELHKGFIFKLEYHELGMAFRGIAAAQWQDGEVLLDDRYWDMTKKDFVELGYADFIENDDETSKGGTDALSPCPVSTSG